MAFRALEQARDGWQVSHMQRHTEHDGADEERPSMFLQLACSLVHGSPAGLLLVDSIRTGIKALRTGIKAVSKES